MNELEKYYKRVDEDKIRSTVLKNLKKSTKLYVDSNNQEFRNQLLESLVIYVQTMSSSNFVFAKKKQLHKYNKMVAVNHFILLFNIQEW